MKKLIAMLGAVVAAVTSAWAALPEPFAQWSSIVDNAKGGEEGTPGAGLTLTAGSATIADGVATFTKATSGLSNDGMRITWDASAYTAKKMTVLIEYSDYDDSGIANNCIMSAEWADNVGEVLAGGRGNNDAGKLSVAYGVTANAGGAIVSGSSVVPKAGVLMLSMSGDIPVKGTRLAMAPKYHDGTTLKFVEVFNNGGITYTGGRFKSLRFGGALPDTSKYHRPGLKIKSIKIYNTFLTAADMNAELYPTPELESDDPYAVFVQNFENRIVSVSSSGDVNMGSSAAQAKVKIFDLATKANTDVEFLGAGTGYTSFPGNYMSRNAVHGWNMFCDTQAGYGAPGVVLRFPTYDSENPTSLSIKGCFQPMCLGGLMVEEGAANGTTNPKLAWDGTNRQTKLGDQRATGGVPTFFVLKDDLTLDRGAETTIYGDITFDIASGKKLHFGSGAITLNNGAVLHLKGAGTIKYDNRSNNSSAINASGKTLDFTGKTSADDAAYFVGPLTVDADTVVKLPASVTAGEGFALCTGTLTAPEGDARKTITVGESELDVIVSYDSSKKTMTYKEIVALIGDNAYASVEEAIAALQEGEVITLVKTDIELPEGWAKVTKDDVVTLRQAGSINFVSGYMGSSGVELVLKTSDGGVTTLLAGDTIIIGTATSAAEAWMADTFAAKSFKIEKNFALHSGTAGAILGNATVNVAEGVVLTISTSGSNATKLGSVEINGAVAVTTNLEATAITGTATITIADIELTLPSKGETVEIVSGVAGKKVVCNDGVYTLVDKTPLEIFTETINAAAEGATVQLPEGLVGCLKIENANNITLDLNGKTITADTTATIRHEGPGTLTIMDSVGGGKVVNTANAADMGIAVWARGGSVAIEGGVFESASLYEATVYIGAATASGKTITISGGTFRNVAEGKYHWKQTLDPIVLNVWNSMEPTAISVTGGSFSSDPANGDDNKGGTFLAEGYVSTLNETSGLYDVTKKSTPTRPSVIDGGSAEQQSAYQTWAAANGVTGSTTAKLADAFAIGATGTDEATVLANAEKKLASLITDAMVQKLAADGATTETTVTIEGYGSATFKFVPVSLGEGVTTSAKLFRLTAEFVPANGQN